MKEDADFHSPPPPDDPHDPLLAALRQHLGENFGQEPPAALWAGIRQQLPGAPRPWWRSWRLLPLLALLVGIVALGVFSARQTGWLGGHAAAPLATSKSAKSAHSPATSAGSNATPVVSQPTSWQAINEPLRATGAPGSSVQSHAALGPQPYSPSAAAAQAASGRAGARQAAGVAALASEQPTGTTREQAAHSSAAAPSRRSQHLGLTALRHTPKHSGTPDQPRAGLLAARPFRSSPGTATQAPMASTDAEQQTTKRTASAAANQSAAAKQQRATAPAATVATSGSARKRNRRRSAPAGSLPTSSEAADVNMGLGAPQAATPDSRSVYAAPPATNFDMAAITGPPTALDSLASRRATLLLATPSRPAVLAPTADSSKRWFPLARRWSVLVLAGPTLSFRTVRPATAGGLVASAPAAIPTSSFNNFNGARTTSANVVDLERPAAGLGAQVQVRRVLTGRWALAFGVGYQEYATRLALQVTKRYAVAQPTSPASNISYLDSTFSVHHRDTYQLLTLPLQLSYALGAPRGRLAVSLLGGLEPSWYVGGRTTEGTSCNCEQQSFSSASGSPYNAFSLGLSLGLDARYRLGGPASRWQWVLQPTGRYIASPFVRSNTLFARRQPYSLGLLTGLAWEF